MHKLRYTMDSYFDFMHQGESNPPGLSKRFYTKAATVLKMRELGERHGTTLWSSSSGWGLRACLWHEQSIASLSRASLFVSVSLCFISQCVRKHYLMIFNLILCSIPPLNSNRRRRRVGNLQRVRHLASFRKAKFIDELESDHNESSGLF